MTAWSLAPYRRRIGRTARDAAACFALALLPTVALAQDAPADKGGADRGSTDRGSADKAPALRLQLNKTETAGEACRITMVVDNTRGPGLKSYKLDLFAFDPEGIAQRRVAVELGPLPPRKTTVKIFDFPGIACGKIGRVLLNDVLACDGGEGAREGCLERTETESKTGFPFDR